MFPWAQKGDPGSPLINQKTSFGMKFIFLTTSPHVPLTRAVISHVYIPSENEKKNEIKSGHSSVSPERASIKTSLIYVHIYMVMFHWGRVFAHAAAAIVKLHSRTAVVVRSNGLLFNTDEIILYFPGINWNIFTRNYECTRSRNNCPRTLMIFF